MLTRLPFYSVHTFRDAYTAEHAAAIEAARNGTQAERDTLQAAFKLAQEAEEKRIEGERKRIAAANAAAFLANPRAVLDWLYEGRTTGGFTLGEMILLYGVASVKLKRAGKGTLMHKGTLAEGTVSPFDAHVTIGPIATVIPVGCRNDRRSKNDAAACAAAQAAQRIANELP